MKLYAVVGVVPAHQLEKSRVRLFGFTNAHSRRHLFHRVIELNEALMWAGTVARRYLGASGRHRAVPAVTEGDLTVRRVEMVDARARVCSREVTEGPPVPPCHVDGLRPWDNRREVDEEPLVGASGRVRG